MVTTATVIAANRFGLGARPAELATLGDDPRPALDRQLKGGGGVPPGQLASTGTILGEFFAARAERRSAKNQPTAQDGGKPDPGARVREVLLPHYLAQAAARVQLAATTDQPLRERLVYFWSNHFAVSVDKVVCLGIAGSFENEAIRPHVLGRFRDLLTAVEQHPAMILYLDNQASIGPHSTLAQRVAGRQGRLPTARVRKLDINENLAREILELHTLGVNGGYTQQDVSEFARVITGWSVGGGEGPLAGGQPGEFLFRENLHEPGARGVLGRRYPEGGLDQGAAVLDQLAVHPSTARHLAGKLARHFIADDVPPDTIERLTQVWLAHEGDLPTVYRALLAEAASWRQARTKLKTPWDYVISVYRGLDAMPAGPRALIAPFELLGQRIWSPGSPAGWPDTAEAWDGADGLMKRIEWAHAVGERTRAAESPAEIAASMLGSTVSERTGTALSRAESGGQAIALLLVSPEVLRR